MKKTTTIFLALLFVAFGVSAASAVVITPAEWALNTDGTVDYKPGGFSGLDTVTVNLSGAGAHYVAWYFDDEIDELDNGFHNEVGSDSGSPLAGQSWEIDEPGWVYGNIYDNFKISSLDNSNGVSTPEDVSMAMGWNFSLAADETATINFYVTDTLPSGFYLAQFDPDSFATIYLSSTLEVRKHGVPEPGTLLLLGTGLVGLLGWGRKKFSA